jgi:hypothetical protein
LPKVKKSEGVIKGKGFTVTGDEEIGKRRSRGRG